MVAIQWLVVLILAQLVSPQPLTTEVATPTTTTATPNPAVHGCPALSACLMDNGCSICLNRTRQYAHHVGSIPESGILQKHFFLTLYDTPECRSTPHHMLSTTFQVSTPESV